MYILHLQILKTTIASLLKWHCKIKYFMINHVHGQISNWNFQAGLQTQCLYFTHLPFSHYSPRPPPLQIPNPHGDKNPFFWAMTRNRMLICGHTHWLQSRKRARQTDAHTGSGSWTETVVIISGRKISHALAKHWERVCARLKSFLPIQKIFRFLGRS